MLVIVPIVAKTQQYCSILDIQFEINQKTVQREAEEKIDKVGIFMRKYPNTTAVIEGHSDEVGTAAANMKLSEQRAAGRGGLPGGSQRHRPIPAPGRGLRRDAPDRATTAPRLANG